MLVYNWFSLALSFSFGAEKLPVLSRNGSQGPVSRKSRGSFLGPENYFVFGVFAFNIIVSIILTMTQ